MDCIYIHRLFLLKVGTTSLTRWSKARHKFRKVYLETYIQQTLFLKITNILNQVPAQFSYTLIVIELKTTEL